MMFTPVCREFRECVMNFVVMEPSYRSAPVSRHFLQACILRAPRLKATGLSHLTRICEGEISGGAQKPRHRGRTTLDSRPFFHG